MHAWIGAVFSLVVLVLVALGKAGYANIPEPIGGTPMLHVMFLLGAAGFGLCLGFIAPSWSSARVASKWSASCLAFVVLALNIDVITGTSRPSLEQVVQGPDLKPTVAETAGAEIAESAKKEIDLSPGNDRYMAEFQWSVMEADRQQARSKPIELPRDVQMQ